MNFSAGRRIALFVAAIIPFIVLPTALAWSVGPLARAGARLCDRALMRLPHGAARASGFEPSRENPIGSSSEPRSDERTANDNAAADERTLRLNAQHGALRFSAPRNDASGISIAGSNGGANDAKRSATARRARPNVFVGPESVQRAIPAGGRPTSAWTNQTAQHPAGLLIQSPGALAGVIEAGDILVEAEGQALGSFEQLLVTVRQAYERRAKRLSGRLFRRGDVVPVTVEPGW